MEINAPRETLDIMVDGKVVELFMSFGLLHELIPQVGDLSNVGMIAIETRLRESVLNSLLAVRDPKGKILEPVNFYTLKIKAEAVQEAVLWVQEHLLDFFLKAIENGAKAHLPHLDRLKAPTLMPSGTGS